MVELSEYPITACVKGQKFISPSRKECVGCKFNRNEHCWVITDFVNGIKKELQLATSQLKELLSALYQRTGEKGFTLYRKDIVELANDYGIKEEELK